MNNWASKAKMAGVAALVFMLAAFVFQNTGVVSIRFLLWEFSLSRVLLLLGAFGVGLIAGVVVGWELLGKKKRH